MAGASVKMGVDVTQFKQGMRDAQASVKTLDAELKKSEAQAIVDEIILDQNLTAPVKKGDKVGEVRFSLNDEVIGSVDVVAAENVNKMSFWTAFLWILYGITQ